VLNVLSRETEVLAQDMVHVYRMTHGGGITKKLDEEDVVVIGGWNSILPVGRPPRIFLVKTSSVSEGSSSSLRASLAS